ncbi:hypothetical protein Poly24_13960 [Rosistilla carotiformis]|uniref:Knr4/Smi1-like domain-containing protein n=2 Tax=Rosistilla carotiformis TaxID=2528017 RepID=A0A518JQ73_9BACT|nr:hypothetical protein Poly24_13960 [Rosistilla carotiformis]
MIRSGGGHRFEVAESFPAARISPSLSDRTMNNADTIADLQRRISVFPPIDCVTNLTVAPPPPLAPALVSEFETATNLRLPSFIRRLYSEVANGGFGPAYGIVPLIASGDDTILDWNSRYRSANRSEPDGPQWPDHLLHFCEGGCVTTYVLDIRTDEAPVYKVDADASNNIYDWLHLVSPSVESWLADWARHPVTQDRG